MDERWTTPEPKPGRFFLAKQIVLFAGLALFIALLDLFLYIAIMAFEMNEISLHENEPGTVVRMVSDALVADPQGHYTLDDASVESTLSKESCWALLLDENGQVIWSYAQPESVPSGFSQNDIALMTHYRNYDQYPVFIWTHDEKLVVVGYPAGSYINGSYSISEATSQKIPLYVTGVLLLDAFIFFLLYLISRRSVDKQVEPTIQALDDLAQGKPVTVSFSGALRSIGEKINRVSDTLLRKDAARKNWVAGVSHDVRTPLSVIMGRAERIASDSNSSPQTRTSATIITAQGERIRDLIEDLNIATQLEYDIQPLRVAPIKMARMMRDIVADYLNRGLEERYSFDLNISDGAEAITLFGDEKLLRRAVINALNNAVKHNPQGCAITLTLEGTQTSFTLTIADDGQGMDTQALRNLIAVMRYTTEEEGITPGKTARPLSEYPNVVDQRVIGAPEPPPVDPAWRYDDTSLFSAQPISTPPRIALAEDLEPSRTDEVRKAPSRIGGSPTKNTPPTPPLPDAGYFKATEGIDSVASSAGHNDPQSAPEEDLLLKQHGLGIPLIVRIVLTHNGTIVLGSEPGEGFSIRMHFEQDPLP